RAERIVPATQLIELLSEVRGKKLGIRLHPLGGGKIVAGDLLLLGAEVRRLRDGAVAHQRGFLLDHETELVEEIRNDRDQPLAFGNGLDARREGRGGGEVLHVVLRQRRSANRLTSRSPPVVR